MERPTKVETTLHEVAAMAVQRTAPMVTRRESHRSR